jgi:hypothetical protein
MADAGLDPDMVILREVSTEGEAAREWSTSRVRGHRARALEVRDGSDAACALARARPGVAVTCVEPCRAGGLRPLFQAPLLLE